MMRDELEREMTDVAERYFGALAVGLRLAAADLRSEWWSLKDRFDAIDNPAHVTPSNTAHRIEVTRAVTIDDHGRPAPATEPNPQGDAR